MNAKLVRYDAMCRAIAAAHEVDEVKEIRDKAIALEHYSRLAQNVEAERQCCEIRLRAERKAGQLLRQREKAKGNQYGTSAKPTLHDYGISRDQSSHWQRLAGVPDGQFEAALQGPDKPTTGGILSAAKPSMPVSDEAVWIWGRLREFERRGLFDRPPAEVLATMTQPMIGDVQTLVGKVIDWLIKLEREVSEDGTGETGEAAQ